MEECKSVSRRACLRNSKHLQKLWSILFLLISYTKSLQKLWFLLDPTSDRISVLILWLAGEHKILSRNLRFGDSRWHSVPKEGISSQKSRQVTNKSCPTREPLPDFSGNREAAVRFPIFREIGNRPSDSRFFWKSELDREIGQWRRFHYEFARAGALFWMVLWIWVLCPREKTQRKNARTLAMVRSQTLRLVANRLSLWKTRKGKNKLFNFGIIVKMSMQW